MDDETLLSTLCANCHLKPDRILLLICNHHTCMHCAATHLTQFSESFTCPICKRETTLEASSVVELLRISSETAFSSFRSLTPGALFRPESSLRERCREHPDEDVAYYCFDCQTRCICSECVIHGLHKGHQVKSLRKSFPIMKGKVEDMVMSITGKLDALSGLDHRLDASLQELDMQNRNITRQMSESFQELHLLLVTKQKQLEEETKAVVEEHLAHIHYYRKLLNKRIAWLQELAQSFQTVVDRNSQSEILDFYTANVETVVLSKEIEDAEMQQIERLGKLSYSLDMSSAASHIGSLQGLKIMIENLEAPREVLSMHSAPTDRQRRKEVRLLPKQRLFDSPL